jgi:hypothetical protein
VLFDGVEVIEGMQELSFVFRRATTIGSVHGKEDHAQEEEGDSAKGQGNDLLGVKRHLGDSIG